VAEDGEHGEAPRRGDASRRATWLYALGDMEASIVGDFFPNLRKILIVAMQVNPLLIGFIEAVTALWEAVAGPLVGHFSDRSRSRWGRRKPFIVFGGFGRALVLLAVVAWLPLTVGIARNDVMEAQRLAKEGREAALELQREALAYWSGAAAEVPPEWRERLETRGGEMRRARGVLGEELDRRSEDGVGLDDQEPVRAALALAEEGLERLVAAGALIGAADAGEAGRAAVMERAERIAGGVLTEERLFEAPRVAKRVADPGGVAFWEPLAEGWRAIFSVEAESTRRLVLYVLIASLLFATLHKFHGIPYHGFGLELCPSYEGRTRVVTYRKAVSKVGSLVAPWIPVFCFSLLFAHAVEGLWWVALLGCVVGIPSTLILCLCVREPRRPPEGSSRPGFFRSFAALSGNRHLLRLLAIFITVGLANGSFQGFNFILNTYWVMGSAYEASKLGLALSMLAWVLGFLSLPVIQWGCGRFQKHRVLIAALLMMIVGTALKWWAFDPEHPEYQFVLPFIFSLGIGSVYTVLATMLSDIADDDQLRHGVRREAMLGAVMGSLMKVTGILAPLVGGAALVASGFDASLEFEQTPPAVFKLRLLNSWVPAVLLLLPLALTWKYPLTRERVEANKAALEERGTG